MDFQGDSSVASVWASFEPRRRNETLENIIQFLFTIDAVSFLANSRAKNPLSQKKQEELTSFFPPCHDPDSVAYCSYFLASEKSSYLPVLCRHLALETSIKISSAATAVHEHVLLVQSSLAAAVMGVGEMRRHHMKHSIARIVKLSTAC